MTDGKALEVKQKMGNVRTALTAMQPELKKALPSHLPIDSFVRAALTLTQKNPLLLECDKMSFLGAVMEAAQLGLVLGREAHLVPFYSNKRKSYEVQMITDYKGLIKLVENSGAVHNVRAHVVRLNDDFQANQDGSIDFQPAFEQGKVVDLGPVTYILPQPKQPIWCVFAEARRSNGSHQSVVLLMDEVEAARDKSKNPGGVWTEHFEEMAKKTAIRKLCKYIPQSPQILRVNELEDLHAENRNQGLKAHVDAEYLPEFETADATTVKQENQKGEEENEKARRDKYLKDIRTAMAKLIDTGTKDMEIRKALGVKELAELDKMDSKQLDAAFDALLELESR